MNDAMDGDFYKSFACFGSEVRLYIGKRISADAVPAEIAAAGVEALMRMMHDRLSRFRPESELCNLNASPHADVEASPLLRLCVKAAIHVGEVSGGLVDPTVIGDLERAGYRESRARATPAPLVDAIEAAPPRRRALAAHAANWRRFKVDDDAGVVSRPAGLRLDSGGVGKGLAADLAVQRLDGFERVLVDVGGDIRARVNDGVVEPYEVQVEHPLSGEPTHAFAIGNEAIATSGLATRVWRTESGYAHHLIDPARGTPAWTGVIQTTAVAGTALEAETLAKMALLAGPDGARAVLRDGRGGALVLDDGSVETFGDAATPANLQAAAA